MNSVLPQKVKSAQNNAGGRYLKNDLGARAHAHTSFFQSERQTILPCGLILQMLKQAQCSLAGRLAAGSFAPPFPEAAGAARWSLEGTTPKGTFLFNVKQGLLPLQNWMEGTEEDGEH